MKKITAFIIATVLASALVDISHAIELSISPSQQLASLGTPVQADVLISGLGDGTAPSLGAFDIKVTFDPGVLEFSGYSLGTQLGSNPIVAVKPGLGVVNLSAISLASATLLNNAQAGSFSLATLSFNPLTLGASPLNLQVNVLGDAFGNPLSASVVQSGTVTVVPLSTNEGLTAGAILTSCRGLNADPSTTLTPGQRDLRDQCNAIIGAGITGDVTGAAEAVAAVTPEQVVAPSSMAVQLSSTQLVNIRSRFAALRLMTSRPGLTGLALNFGGQSLSEPLLADTSSLGVRGGGASADEGADDGGSFGKLGVWLNGDYNFGNQDQTTNEEGFDFDNIGVTLGADYRVTDQLVLGAALGYANTNVDFDNNRGNLDRDGWAGSLYGMYYFGERFYVDGIVNYSANSFDQQRRFSYVLPDASVARTAKASYDGNGYALSVGGGYEDNRGPLTLGGYARFGYGKLDIDSYQETGALGWNMGFDSQQVKSLTSTLGGRILRIVSTDFGVLVPQGWVEWIHEFEDNDKVTGRLINAADPSQGTFTLTPDPIDKDYFRLGVGVSAQFANGRSAFIAYQGTLGMKNFGENDITAGVRLEF